MNFTAEKTALLTPEQDAAFTARWRLTHDGPFAKSFKLTDEQIKQLGEVQGKGGLVADEADKERLRGLLDAFAAAPDPKQNEEKALVAALAEIGPKSVELTRKSLLERVDRINSILTPEQIAQFKQQAQR
jgi:Spy/CpxP family protein refolding chaperone